MFAKHCQNMYLIQPLWITALSVFTPRPHLKGNGHCIQQHFIRFTVSNFTQCLNKYKSATITSSRDNGWAQGLNDQKMNFETKSFGGAGVGVVVKHGGFRL